MKAKNIAKKAVKGFFLGSGVAVWALIIIGTVSGKMTIQKIELDKEDDLSDLPDDIREMLS